MGTQVGPIIGGELHRHVPGQSQCCGWKSTWDSFTIARCIQQHVSGNFEKQALLHSGGYVAHPGPHREVKERKRERMRVREISMVLPLL